MKTLDGDEITPSLLASYLAGDFGLIDQGYSFDGALRFVSEPQDDGTIALYVFVFDADGEGHQKQRIVMTLEDS
jgi:hypothetical protein